MSDAQSNGVAEWPKPAVPTWITIAAVIIAVGAVTALLWLMFQKTTGPGEVVKDYYAAVAGGDCDNAYGYLAAGTEDKSTFCAFVSSRQADVPGDPTVESVTLLGEAGEATQAHVAIDEGSGEPAVWELRRDGEIWVIFAAPKTGALAGV